MSLPQINFRQIAPRLGSQDEAFEEFCCQIARQEAMPASSEFVRIRGAGGDGGVECLWIKPDGTKSGWQAKFIFDFDRALVALTGSLATALQVHSTLSEFVVCLPYDLTGTTNRSGKSQQQKFTEWRDGEIAKAKASGRNLTIDLRAHSSLLDRLTEIDPSNGRLRFWFDETLLGPNWFANHLADVRAAARPRYTPELSIETTVSIAFDALCDTPTWKAVVSKRLNRVKVALRDWERGLGETGKVWGTPFPESIKGQGATAKETLGALLASFESLNRGEASVSNLLIADQVLDAESAFRTITEDLRAALETEHGPGKAENASWKQFMSEYELKFPAQHYDKGKEIVELCAELRDWIGGEAVKVNGRGAMLLTGQAGVGKTHAVCDVSDRRLDAGLLTVVAFAEALPGVGEVADNLRAKLGLPADIGRDELLSILNSAGEMSGGPLLIAIDGLNETQPRSYWLNQLPAWAQQVGRFPFLRLCVSCRTTYVENAVPATLDIARVGHVGFAGMEYEACCEFCEHYGLEHPAMPFLAEEFANGLFLRLVCEATREEGLPRIPSGSYGTRSAINAFLNSKDRRYSERFAVDVRRKYPSKAVRSLADEMASRETRSTNFDDAQTIIANACSGAPAHLLEWLVEEGLIRVDAVMVNGQSEDHAFLPFERLGDHLLAERHLEHETAESILSAFYEGGKLAFLLDEEHWDVLAGLREALALQIPESLGVELPALAPESTTKRDFMRLTLKVLTWRDPNSITSSTSDILRIAVSTADLLHTAFEQELLVSLLPSAVDAFWLDRLLKDDLLVNRDWYWCKYLHLSFAKGGSVKRLIDSAFKVEANRLRPPSVERWVVVLGWFCAAADRRVRDSATKAMIRLLTHHSGLWATVISNFLGVDDDYVLERVLAATYGAMLRNPDKVGVAQVATILMDQVFSDTLKFQNALIRDHCRCIVEMGVHLGAIQRGDASSIEPPYQSDWPLKIPTDQEIKALKVKIEGLPTLHHSCFTNDFFIYTMSRLRPYEDQISRKEMAAWIFQEVFAMGYNLEHTREYDGVMSYQHGQGRGRPPWAERVGKKYQWIALARLAARLGDHLTPEEESWDDESLATRLVYESGRDTDPSIISRSGLRDHVPSWWSPYSYPFSQFDSMNDEEWVALREDIPDLRHLVEAVGADGRQWVLLGHYPEWNSRKDTEDLTFDQNYRWVWLHVHSYIVDKSYLAQLQLWADGANWFNRWMPEGRDYYQGFVGEYPWGTPFQVKEYDRGRTRRPDNLAECPAELKPAVHRIVVEQEFDCFQEGSVTVSVPAQEFFTGALRWRPENGFEVAGQKVFFDPTIDKSGSSSMLADKTHLKEWLEANGRALFFTVLGEKLTTGDNSKARMVVAAGATFDGRNWCWTPVSNIMH